MPGKGVTMIPKGSKSKEGVTMLGGKKGAGRSSGVDSYAKVYGSGGASKAQDAIKKRHKKIKDI